MVCALTVRTLKPGTFEQFRKAFTPSDDPQNMPAGWVHFNMIRNTENPDEVICFGFFDGTVDDLRRGAADSGYAEQLEAVAPFVESLGTDGLFEVIEDITPRPGATR
jgi:hypothetical protein